MPTYLTRVVTFSMAHRYHRPDWPDDRNAEVFGACANPHGHGHNYRLEVTVAGIPDPDTGFSIDLPALDSALRATPSRHASFSHEGVPFLEHGLILELKYHRYLPALFRRLVEEFSLEIGGASKYRLAMTALGHAPVETGAVHA